MAITLFVTFIAFSYHVDNDPFLGMLEKAKIVRAIRHLASRFLFGLAHDQDVAQILTKLQVTKKMESICQSGPVVQINKRHHKKFAEYTEALSLLISSSSISFKSSVSST